MRGNNMKNNNNSTADAEKELINNIYAELLKTDETLGLYNQYLDRKRALVHEAEQCSEAIQSIMEGLRQEVGKRVDRLIQVKTQEKSSENKNENSNEYDEALAECYEAINGLVELSMHEDNIENKLEELTSFSDLGNSMLNHQAALHAKALALSKDHPKKSASEILSSGAQKVALKLKSAATSPINLATTLLDDSELKKEKIEKRKNAFEKYKMLLENLDASIKEFREIFSSGKIMTNTKGLEITKNPLHNTPNPLHNLSQKKKDQLHKFLQDKNKTKVSANVSEESIASSIDSSHKEKITSKPEKSKLSGLKVTTNPLHNLSQKEKDELNKFLKNEKKTNKKQAVSANVSEESIGSSSLDASDKGRVSSESEQSKLSRSRPPLRRVYSSRNLKPKREESNELKSSDQPTNKLTKSRSRSLENFGLFQNAENANDNVNKNPANDEKFQPDSTAPSNRNENK